MAAIEPELAVPRHAKHAKQTPMSAHATAFLPSFAIRPPSLKPPSPIQSSVSPGLGLHADVPAFVPRPKSPQPTAFFDPAVDSPFSSGLLDEPPTALPLALPLIISRSSSHVVVTPPTSSEASPATPSVHPFEPERSYAATAAKSPHEKQEPPPPAKILPPPREPPPRWPSWPGPGFEPSSVASPPLVWPALKERVDGNAAARPEEFSINTSDRAHEKATGHRAHAFAIFESSTSTMVLEAVKATLPAVGASEPPRSNPTGSDVAVEEASAAAAVTSHHAEPVEDGAQSSSAPIVAEQISELLPTFDAPPKETISSPAAAEDSLAISVLADARRDNSSLQGAEEASPESVADLLVVKSFEVTILMPVVDKPAHEDQAKDTTVDAASDGKVVSLPPLPADAATAADASASVEQDPLPEAAAAPVSPDVIQNEAIEQVATLTTATLDAAIEASQPRAEPLVGVFEAHDTPAEVEALRLDPGAIVNVVFTPDATDLGQVEPQNPKPELEIVEPLILDVVEPLLCEPLEPINTEALLVIDAPVGADAAADTEPSLASEASSSRLYVDRPSGDAALVPSFNADPDAWTRKWAARRDDDSDTDNSSESDSRGGDRRGDPRVPRHAEEPPSLTLSIFAQPARSRRDRLWAIFGSIAINVFLPFVNGVMLGFGEIFAREYVADWLGIGTALHRTLVGAPTANTGTTVGLRGVQRTGDMPGHPGAKTAAEGTLGAVKVAPGH